jgi:DNA-binding MarR family transcriptional regulator
MVAELRQLLQLLVRQLNPNLPDYLPILGYEMLSKGPESAPPTPDATAPPAEVALPMLLAKVLLAFALDFERESGHSLAIAANVLRLAGEEGIRVRNLPLLSGVSKEAIAMAVKRLEEPGFAVVQHSEQNRRAKVLILTAKGKHARNVYRSLVRKLEQRWEAKFGSHVINLRHSLERLVGGSGSLLYGGLEPYPEGWRASLHRPEVLPHYPMVLHRGGVPDGS